MNQIIKVLMRRDQMCFSEAKQLVKEAKERILDGEDPEMVLEEEFGLELDYIYDII